MSAVEEYRKHIVHTGDMIEFNSELSPIDVVHLADAVIAELEAKNDEVSEMLRLSWRVCIDGSVGYSATKLGAHAHLVFETDDRCRIRNEDQWIDYLRTCLVTNRSAP